MAPVPPFPMHEMTIWEWMLNNPEWVGVFASSLFAFVTIIIIRRQAKDARDAQQRQNRLLQYQLEYARMLSLNNVRDEVLALVSKVAVCFSRVRQSSDEGLWPDLQNAIYDLFDKANRLDSSVYGGYYDGWYANLAAYIDAMAKAIAGQTDIQDRGSVQLVRQ